MKKTVISFFGMNEKWQADYIHKRLPASRFKVNVNGTKLSAANVKKFSSSEVISVFIHSKINTALLDHLPKLRLLVTSSTGFDHIDLEQTRARGIPVCNVPSYGENTVAEHTFALILALSRKLVRAANRTRRGRFHLDGLRGFDLKGRTLGVVGTGHIGQHVIRIAHGFEMKILAYDIKQDRSLENHYPLQYVTLSRLLSESDIVTLHAPYNSHTRHMISKQNIKKFKKGAILINTSRGGLVDTKALLWALNKKILSAAGLDVLEEEGIITEESALISPQFDHSQVEVVLANHKLLSMDNVIVTPHSAFNSDEAVRRIVSTTVDNILAWKKGKLQNLVK